MESVMERAKGLNPEIVQNRRTIHQFAEVGFALPQTIQFVEAALKEYGYETTRVGKSGVVCTVGHGEKTILVRADMDALPMEEKSELPFSSKNGNAHTCGHDCHTAMLLATAKILKDQESTLTGCVKFMFQPAEEDLAGAADMIEAGVLENPAVDAAMALHVVMGIDNADSGVLYYSDAAIAYSGDAIKIHIKGADAHGSRPYLGVDAIAIATYICNALQNIVAKEISAEDEAVVLVGKIAGGTTVNTVAGTATLDISVRAITSETRAFLKQRILQIATHTALAFRGEATVEYVYGMPPMLNNSALCNELIGYANLCLGHENVRRMKKLSGTEDFCMVSEKVPTVLFTLGVGSIKEGYHCGLHHPAMIVNEDVLYVGVAACVCCAVKWLERNSK